MTPAGEASGQVSANGLVFAYLERGPADGPLALCLHGFPDAPWTWRHLLPALARAGFRAVAPWMRGYAPTGIPEGERYDLETLGADANALHAALGGDERAVLLGHDWGALSAYRAAVAEPHRWSRVVGLAVPPEPALAYVAWYPWQLARSWYLAAAQTPGLGRLLRRTDLGFVEMLWHRWSPSHEPDPAHLERIREMLRQPGVLDAALGYYRALRRRVLLRGWPSRSRIGPPPQRTLYLHGDEDGCIGVEFAVFARQLSAGTVRSEIVGGAGHFLHLERPDEVSDLVSSFLGT